MTAIEACRLGGAGMDGPDLLERAAKELERFGDPDRAYLARVLREKAAAEREVITRPTKTCAYTISWEDTEA